MCPSNTFFSVISDEQRNHLLNFIERGEDIIDIWYCCPVNNLFDTQELSKSWCCLRTSADSSRLVARVSGPVVLSTFLNLLQIHTDWPSYLRNKGIFFVKRDRLGIPELGQEDQDSTDLLDYVTCGDIYPNVLGEKRNQKYDCLPHHCNLTCRPFLCLGGGGHHPDIQEWEQHF